MKTLPVFMALLRSNVWNHTVVLSSRSFGLRYTERIVMVGRQDECCLNNETGHYHGRLTQEIHSLDI